METVLAVVVGGLYAGGLYLILRRSFVKLILGLSLLGHAANLLIFTMSDLTAARGRPPLIPLQTGSLVPPYADPLPQALILTAIVIGFGVQAFALVMLYHTYRIVKTDDLDELHTTDEG